MGVSGVVDSAIASLFPGWALRRAASRAKLDMLAAYQAATKDRTTHDWQAQQTSADQANLTDLPNAFQRLHDTPDEIKILVDPRA